MHQLELPHTETPKEARRRLQHEINAQGLVSYVTGSAYSKAKLARLMEEYAALGPRTYV